MKYLKQNCLRALPTIFISIFLFFSIYYLFGISQVILVSFLTLFFRIRYNYDFSFHILLRTYAIMLLLCFLAHLASLNLSICFFLNFLVPFLIVSLLTDKFNPKAYFIYGMEFVFLQLLPITNEQFITRLAAMVYGFCILTVTLWIHSFYIHKKKHYRIARKGLLNLSCQLKKLAWLEDISTNQKELRRIMQHLTNTIYFCRNYQCLSAEHESINYYFLLIFQRFLYFTNEISSKDPVRTFENQPYYLRLGMLLQKIEKQMNQKNNETLIREIKTFQQNRHLCSEQEEQAMTDLLNLLCFTLDKITEIPVKNSQNNRKNQNLPSNRFADFFRIEQFQTRFALRLSVVLSISFALCRTTEFEYSYWYPMSTFLMLIPYAEESLMKINSRILGTMTGLLISYLFLRCFPSLYAHLLIILVITCFMYSVPITSWTMSLYCVCYGMSLTTGTIPQEESFLPQLLFTGLALFTTLLANYFLLPNTVKSEFKKYIRELFLIDEAILLEIEKGAKGNLDTLRSLMTRSTLLSDEILSYIQHNLNQEEQEFYNQLLPINQQLITEMEQLHSCMLAQYPYISPEHDLLFRELTLNMKGTLKRIKASYTSNELTSFMRADQQFKAFGRLEEELYFNMLALNCMNSANAL